MGKKKSKKKKWIKFRHKVVRNLAFAVLYPYSKIRYGFSFENKKRDKRQYLVLMNHQTGFDQFFLGMGFSGTIYYVASEDLFSNGFISKLLTYLVAPIPIKKQTTDVHAILNCMRVAKEGGSIAIAPEGNRTYSGENVYMNPAISKLAKKLGLPLAFYRIEGGYGIHPRWSNVVRKGKMRGFVSRIIEPEEYKAMGDDELYELICTELYQNDCALGQTFKHKKTAEYLERAMYVCPFCGLSEFESNGDIIQCKSCLSKIRYNEDLSLEGVGFEFPFKDTAEWYAHQCKFVNSLDTRELTDKPIYTDTAKISEVILYKNKRLIEKDCTLNLYGNQITVKGQKGFALNMSFEDVSAVVVLGKNKLNIYHNNTVYQFKGSKRFNALKYVNIYYRNKNIQEGNKNDTFLGL